MRIKTLITVVRWFYLTVAERQTVRTDPAPEDLSLKSRQVRHYSAGLVIPERRIK